MEKFDNLTGVDKEKYDQKMSVMHKGACTSPRNTPGDTWCTCPVECPLHGRCCDCIAHHKEERLAEKNPVKGDTAWMPHCLDYFDERNGIGCPANPKAGSKFFDPSKIDWSTFDPTTFDFSEYTGHIDPSKFDPSMLPPMMQGKENQ